MSRRLLPLVLLSVVISTSVFDAQASTLVVDAGVLQSFRIDPPPGPTLQADCPAADDDSCDAERSNALGEDDDASNATDGVDDPRPSSTEPADPAHESSPSMNDEEDETGGIDNGPNPEHQDRVSIDDEAPAGETPSADPVTSGDGGQPTMQGGTDEVGDDERRVDPGGTDPPASNAP
jgi:hypothetical protein